MTKPKASAAGKAAPAKKRAGVAQSPEQAPSKPKVAGSRPAPRSTGGRIDWEAVKRDFRTGRFTQTELARKHRIDPATLSRKIKADRSVDPEAWPADLSGAVQAATEARLMRELVKTEVKEGQAELTIRAAAEVNAQIILGHRARVRQATDVAMRMLAELDATTHGADKLQEAFDTLTAELSGPALASVQMQFRDLMRLHNRVGSVQKLMGALKDAQALEAQAFSLYEAKKPGASEVENLSDDELDAAIKERAARLGLSE